LTTFHGGKWHRVLKELSGSKALKQAMGVCVLHIILTNQITLHLPDRFRSAVAGGLPTPCPMLTQEPAQVAEHMPMPMLKHKAVHQEARNGNPRQSNPADDQWHNRHPNLIPRRLHKL
jgi:hypothetical protein